MSTGKLPKRVGALLFGLTVLVLLVMSVIKGEVLHARNLKVEGVVKYIEWQSSNHKLPKITLISANGKEIEISHSSIAFSEGSLKAGDKLIKTEIGNYCYINGENIQFSKYLGKNSLGEIFKYVFRQ